MSQYQHWIDCGLPLDHEGPCARQVQYRNTHPPAPEPVDVAKLVQEIEQWHRKGMLPTNGNDEPWLRQGADLLVRARDVLLAAENDYRDMRRFQDKYIACDQELREARERERACEQQRARDKADGEREATRRWAHWKDGIQYVGTCGTTLRAALAQIDAAMQAQAKGEREGG